MRKICKLITGHGIFIRKWNEMKIEHRTVVELNESSYLCNKQCQHQWKINLIKTSCRITWLWIKIFHVLRIIWINLCLCNTNKAAKHVWKWQDSFSQKIDRRTVKLKILMKLKSTTTTEQEITSGSYSNCWCWDKSCFIWNILSVVWFRV